MKKTFIAIFIVAAALLACNDTTFTPVDPTPLPPIPSGPPPRVDQPFSLESNYPYVYFGFGNECQSEEEMVGGLELMLASGWNDPNICAETEFWDEGCGNYPRKPRDPEKLRRILDLTARVPGVQVTLIANCTLKRQVPLQEQYEWAVKVADVAQEFKHIAIYTHNEFDNCAGREDWGGRREWCPGKNEVAKHVQMFRGRGFSVVTADDSIGPRIPGDSEAKSFEFRLANIGASPASFHPAREHKNQPWDPDQKFLEKVARYNGDFILSETVAWMDYSGRCDGLRTCDPDRIDRYIETCAAVPGCTFTLHGENQLMGMPPTRVPRAR